MQVCSVLASNWNMLCLCDKSFAPCESLETRTETASRLEVPLVGFLDGDPKRQGSLPGERNAEVIDSVLTIITA